MMQFLIEHKEVILTLIGIMWAARETVLAPVVRHVIQRMPTKWHINPDTGELVLKGIDKLLMLRFGKTAMLMNAKADPGEATERLAAMLMKHAEEKLLKK